MRPFRFLLLALSAVAIALPVAREAGAQSQSYPSRPVKIVVTYPPGGGMDSMARLLAGPLGERLKQPVVVENRGGASGMIGAEYVARATPDGHTLIIAPADTHSINPHVYPKIPYDAVKDFAPIIQLGALPVTLVVNPSVPARTVDEFVKWARAEPGKHTFASWGVGSGSHVAMETVTLDNKLEMLHVPFTGAAPAITAVIAGQVDAMMVTLPTSEPYHQAGRVRIIGTTPIERLAGSPPLPVGGLPPHLALWIGILAPAKTPPAVVGRLNEEFAAILQDPQIRAGLVKAGLEPVKRTGSPADFSAFLKEQYELWGRPVREAKITAAVK